MSFRVTLPCTREQGEAIAYRADGRALLVYNHSRRGRTPLNLALSRDGRRWQPSLVLEDGPGEYSYPAVVQAKGGRIHVTYTWQRRRICHVELDPAEL